MQYTLKPDASGHLNIDNKSGTYKPGDTLYISGNPKDILITGLMGAAGQRINITNAPGEKLVVGNPAWNGGGYSYAIMFKGCKHINLFGSDKASFLVDGSRTTVVDRGAYFNIRIDELSDNFSVHDISVRNGGNAIWCKTEVSKTDARTWAPNYLENFEFYNLDIRGTYTEGLYIGHTATWWNIVTPGPYYSGTPTDLNTYKQPAKLRNVIIRNCYVEGAGMDGIQTAAIDNLQVYNNEVVNWGVNRNSGHCGGILIGGRVKGFDVHDNYVHDGWGDMIQVYAEGGAVGKIINNLLVNNTSPISEEIAYNAAGIFLRGTDNLITEVTNNTIVSTNSSSIRVNGYYGQKGKQIITNNILAQPQYISTMGARNYIYEENGGVFTDVGNQKFQTLADAKLDSKFIPLAGTTAAGYGYKLPVPPTPPPDSPATITITSQALGDFLKTLKPGEYPISLLIKDEGAADKTIGIKLVIS